MMNFKSQKMTL